MEADVGQVVLNERFALFYPEKRPFFLDGLELFDTPNQLIYTRSIVAPRGGAKLAGKLGGTNLATMVVADDTAYSWSGGHTPLFGILRARHDLPGSGTAGAVLTDREDGPDHSRLGRTSIFGSITRSSITSSSRPPNHGPARRDRAGRARCCRPMWDRTGRGWGFHYSLQAISPEFNAAAGFVNRTGILNAQIFNRLSFYGRPGSAGADLRADSSASAESGTTPTLASARSKGASSISPSATIRGGWQSADRWGGIFSAMSRRDMPDSRSRPESPVPSIRSPSRCPAASDNQWSGSLRVTTPTYRQFTATASISAGQVPIFREAAPGSSFRVDASVDLRPTAALRTTLQFSRLTLTRRRDGSRFSTETIPRIKVEYQVSRALFLRMVGQYDALTTAALEDRQGRPILVGGEKDQGIRSNEFRMDWLFSYRPAPGTLLYFGYGSTMHEPRQFRFGDLSRTTDGFFGKVSYVFRL